MVTATARPTGPAAGSWPRRPAAAPRTSAEREVWALAAGSARDWFARTPGRIEVLTAIGGALLVVLAVVLAVLP